MPFRPLLLALLCSLASFAVAQESTATLVNPFDTRGDRDAGGRTFLAQCASCHGQDGRGTSAGPDLSTGNFKRASSDEGLFQIVAKGVPGTVMPGFNLAGREIWQVLAYIRSLNIGRSTEIVKGNKSRGAALFESSGCAGCHDGLGGPDLSGIGRRRSLAELRQSILEPQAEVDSEWWRIRAVTRDGATVTGRRLNEDTYSIQFVDGGGRLRAALKSDLARHEILRDSPMPSFREKLTSSQIDDVLAYLVSKGAP
jgi:putative heme-binding domain-containing protein